MIAKRRNRSRNTPRAMARLCISRLTSKVQCAVVKQVNASDTITINANREVSGRLTGAQQLSSHVHRVVARRAGRRVLARTPPFGGLRFADPPCAFREQGALCSRACSCRDVVAWHGGGHLPPAAPASAAIAVAHPLWKSLLRAALWSRAISSTRGRYFRPRPLSPPAGRL